MMLSVTQNIARNDWTILGKEVEGIWKEAVLIYIKVQYRPIHKHFNSFS
jgi:hypothetical protein